MKLPIHKTARRATTIFVNADQHSSLVRVRLIMGKGLTPEIGFQTLLPFGAIHRFETFREWSSRRVTT